MSKSEGLIPVFIPPLAHVLGLAEQKKGNPLTASEVERVRDSATCIMMEPADAKKMADSRGFVDVNPENVWADWHRLRVQITGRGYLPKLVLCIPGDDDFRARSEILLRNEGIEHEFQPHDVRLESAFRKSSVTWPSFTEDDYRRIASHKNVLYVLSKNVVAAAAPAVAQSFFGVGRQLLEAGGIAIKCESSGISHPAARWIKFDETAKSGGPEKWVALFHAYVVHPIGSNTDLYTCGMHLLGAPDLIVSSDLINSKTKAGKSADLQAIELFMTFAVYLLAECPPGYFSSRHTFSIDRESPRYRVVWEPCSGYAEDDLFFNPFGRWRFTAP